VTGSLIILLLKGQIHSDGTLGAPPTPTEAISGDTGGDAPLAWVIESGCNDHKKSYKNQHMNAIRR
jgi:hypothetical protein